jgi:hypothetical protein
MIPLFLGLSAANLLLLAIVFGLGLFAVDPAGKATTMYGYHLVMGFAAGLLTALAHLAVYTYFMATSKWLNAAADKAGLDPARYVSPALARKRRVLPVALGAIGVTMLAMFAGAAADPTVRPWWPAEVHLATAALAIAANALGALMEYRLIRDQGALMDLALAVFNTDAAAGAPAAASSEPGIR